MLLSLGFLDPREILGDGMAGSTKLLIFGEGIAPSHGYLEQPTRPQSIWFSIEL